MKVISAIQNNKVPLITSMGLYFSGIVVAVFLFYLFDSSTSSTRIDLSNYRQVKLI